MRDKSAGTALPTRVPLHAAVTQRSGGRWRGGGGERRPASGVRAKGTTLLPAGTSGAQRGGERAARAVARRRADWRHVVRRYYSARAVPPRTVAADEPLLQE